MADYEITYTSDAEAAEESRVQLDRELDAYLQEVGAAVNFTSPNIPRRLFFPIKGKRAAGLRTLQVELDPEKVQEVRNFFKKLSGILRFSILQTPRRSELPAGIAELLRQKRGRGASAALTPIRKSPRKSAAPVTMEEVEKGIEKALDEEVK